MGRQAEIQRLLWAMKESYNFCRTTSELRNYAYARSAARGRYRSRDRSIVVKFAPRANAIPCGSTGRDSTRLDSTRFDSIRFDVKTIPSDAADYARLSAAVSRRSPTPTSIESAWSRWERRATQSSWRLHMEARFRERKKKRSGGILSPRRVIYLSESCCCIDDKPRWGGEGGGRSGSSRKGLNII